MLKYISRIDIPSRDLFKSIIETYSFWGGDINHHIKTYIMTRLLKTKGAYPTSDKCVECGRHDRINGFEFYKGGFTCVLHTKKERDLEYLKGIKDLLSSFREYMVTNSYTNKNIFDELIAFINET